MLCPQASAPFSMPLLLPQSPGLRDVPTTLTAPPTQSQSNPHYVMFPNNIAPPVHCLGDWLCPRPTALDQPSSQPHAVGPTQAKQLRDLSIADPQIPGPGVLSRVLLSCLSNSRVDDHTLPDHLVIPPDTATNTPDYLGLIIISL